MAVLGAIAVVKSAEETPRTPSRLSKKIKVIAGGVDKKNTVRREGRRQFNGMKGFWQGG
ncbi:MAG: hypothetical protein LBT97_06705 [Planctomycetota bacterium]|jgi:hypothetical protein|nr:hypothetical protein [Planctomycetota bacterium]